MRNRIDEICARDAFAPHLQARGYPGAVWEPGSQPPDWYLTLTAECYAVEVTQVMETVAVGGLKLSERGLTGALNRAVADLEEEAKRAGILSGAYHIHVCPLPDL